MPDEPLELESVSMFGFGAIPNLEIAMASDAPLKRRLRPRRCSSTETLPNDADAFIVNVKPRRREKSSTWRPSLSAESASSVRQRPLKPKPDDKMLPMEIQDSEKPNPGL
ncbi:hypothetical protein E4U41_001599 [Claviceps citrina]|nr:hypothetical protein E4U41_001599 [Claviceps citrina]